MRISNRITGISGVVSGGLATIPLEVNRRYHTIKLQTFSNGSAAAASTVIDMVRVKVNEQTIWELTAAQLLKLNALDRIANATGELSLNFSNPALADIIDEEATAFDLFGERSFKIELVLKTLAGGAVPTIEGTAIFDFGGTFDRASGRRVKTIVRRSYITQAVPAGVYDLTTLSIKNPILRILLDGAEDITAVEVRADNLSVIEASSVINARILADYGIDATQFKYPVCFNFTNRLTDFLAVSSSLNVKLTSANSQTLTAISETITPDYQ